MTYFVKPSEGNRYGNEMIWSRVVGATAAGIVVLFLVIFGFFAAVKGFSRYQQRADRSQSRSQALKDAQNKVRVTHIQIKNQQQRVKIAEQHAEIRYKNAIGIRESQDEIAKTLTPLYVQFEMTQALLEIAKSGENSSVVYLPSGANGIPLVSTVDPTQVKQPDK